MSIWKNIICSETIARTLTLDWSGWYKANIHCKVSCYGGMKWCSIFMFTCWQIWKWRNLAVFEEETQPPFQPVKTIIDNATAWYNAQDFGKQKQGSKCIALKWNKPNTGWFKLNVDGARNVHNGRIRAGGVIRDYTGVWIEGFFAHIGIGEVIEAEAWGLLLGLKMAVKLKIERLEVECDSELLVNMINQGANQLHPLKTIINSCIELQNTFIDCRVMHIYREINKVADSLAKCSLDRDLGVQVLDQPPMHITQALLDDLSDFPCFRNVP